MLADKEDIEELSKLRILQQKDDWQEEYPNKDEELYVNTKKYLEEHLNNDIFVFIERQDDKIVATCGIQIIQYMPQCVESGLEAYICDVFTLKEYRRKGIQTRLIDECLNFSKDRGLIKIRISTDSEDGMSLYKKFGFEFDKLMMKKFLK